MPILETFEFAGQTIKIHTDDEPLNPRTEYDNLGTMACFHGRYNLGDEKHGLSIEEVKSLVERKDVISLPLFLIDHSMLSMSTGKFSCPWDSGQVGQIFIKLEDVRKEYEVKRVTKQLREKVLEYLKGEVEIYDLYLQGECYGYEVEKDGEKIDSCWGFLGGLDECKFQARAAAECENEEVQKIAKSFG